MFSSYQEMYYASKSMEFIVRKRLDMVHMALESGFKPTARFYNTDRNTVRKWVRRYQLEGIKGLRDRNKRPLNSPSKINQSDIDKITETCKWALEKGKYITVRNIRKKTKIKQYSDVTINRYIRKAISKPKKKCDKTNGGSVLFKDFLKPFEIIQIDIKYLTDIDNLHPYFDTQNLAKYQITARDVYTGFPIVAYCHEKSPYFTTMFLETVLAPFLKQFKYIDFRDITIQTDNGTEFTNKYIHTSFNVPMKRFNFTISSTMSWYISSMFLKSFSNKNSKSSISSFMSIFCMYILICKFSAIISLNSNISKIINTYVHTIISTRGFSPYNKIKETLKVNSFKVPKPTLLTYKISK